MITLPAILLVNREVTVVFTPFLTLIREVCRYQLSIYGPFHSTATTHFSPAAISACHLVCYNLNVNWI